MNGTVSLQQDKVNPAEVYCKPTQFREQFIFVIFAYSQGGKYREDKSPKKFGTSIRSNKRRKRNAKIYRRKMAFHQQNAKISSRENK